MKKQAVNTSKLLSYIKGNEVVFQRYNELMEISNGENPENRESLIQELKDAAVIEIYSKDDQFIKEPFADLNNWAIKDDVFFLLEVIGTLICIPKKYVEENGIIIEK